MTLWTAKTADVLPDDRRQLEGVSRILEYPTGSASQLEEDYLRTTRLARQVFERTFYGKGWRRSSARQPSEVDCVGMFHDDRHILGRRMTTCT